MGLRGDRLRRAGDGKRGPATDGGLPQIEVVGRQNLAILPHFFGRGGYLHQVRRAVFSIYLPLAELACTVQSKFSSLRGHRERREGRVVPRLRRRRQNKHNEQIHVAGLAIPLRRLLHYQRRRKGLYPRPANAHLQVSRNPQPASGGRRPRRQAGVGSHVVVADVPLQEA